MRSVVPAVDVGNECFGPLTLGGVRVPGRLPPIKAAKLWVLCSVSAVCVGLCGGSDFEVPGDTSGNDEDSLSGDCPIGSTYS